MAKFMRSVPLKFQYQCKGCGVFTFKTLLSPASKCPDCVEKARESARSGVQIREGLDVPCQSSNNCIGPQTETTKFEISAQYRKSTTALEINVESFCKNHKFENIGFLTLTFDDDVLCPKEAQRRFKSLRTNFLSKYFGDYVRCTERQKNGRIHFHLIIDCGMDIRRGFNFPQFYDKSAGKKRYASANKKLKAFWTLLRKSMAKYGFGRHELMPIRTSPEKLAKYVGKYISKHVQARLPEDKGIRLVQCSADKASKWKVANSNFAFVSWGAMMWRKKLKTYVETNQSYWGKLLDFLGYQGLELNDSNYSELLCIMLGRTWGYKCREIILDQAI
mgnify:FL=1